MPVGLGPQGNSLSVKGKNSLSLVRIACNKVVTEIWVVRVARLMQSNGHISKEVHGFTLHCLHAGQT